MGQLRLVVQENRAHSLGILQSLEPAVRVWAARGVPLLQHPSHLWVSNMMALPHISAPWSPPPSHRLQKEASIPLQGVFLGVPGWWESRGGKKAPKEMTSLWGGSQAVTEVRLGGEWTTGCPSLVLSGRGGGAHPSQGVPFRVCPVPGPSRQNITGWLSSLRSHPAHHPLVGYTTCFYNLFSPVSFIYHMLGTKKKKLRRQKHTRKMSVSAYRIFST